MRFILLLFALMLALSATAQETRVLRPGDHVRVVCEEEPSLSQEYVITQDGLIVMPFLGAIEIVGLTEHAAAQRISQSLIEQRILRRATVTVRLAPPKEQPIRFSGAVRKSGELQPRKGLRLSDIVEMAQPTDAADLMNVEIRTGDGKLLVVDFTRYDGRASEHNPEIRSGDRVVFPVAARQEDVLVLGGVVRPGAIPFRAGMTVREAVQAAGGLDAQGNAEEIRLTRDNKVLRSVNWLNDDEDAVLQAGDVVQVPLVHRRRYITVKGVVGDPGPIEFREGLTLTEAITAAGGPAKGANLRAVVIQRADEGRRETHRIDFEAIQKGKGQDVALTANDTVEVPSVRRHEHTGTIVRAAGLFLLFMRLFGG
jgi:polysaccharide biosynthesis/export protein